MNGDRVLLVILAIFVLVGVWMIVTPVGFIAWFKSARQDLRDNPNFMAMEDDPAAKSFVRFLGVLFIGVTVVSFVAALLAR